MRPGWLAAALGVALATGPGCRGLPRRAEAEATRPPAGVGAPGVNESSPRDVGIERAGFSSEITPEQRISTHIDLARALDDQGRGEDALAEYQKAVEAIEATRKFRGDAAERARLHRRAGGALDRLGKFEEAAAHYKEARRLAPRDADAWNDSGYSLYLRGRFDEAVKALRTARGLDAGNPRILTNLGLALAASDKADEAVEVLTRASGPAAAHANVAYVLAGQGRLEAARAHYRAALAADPHLAAAREGLAQVDRKLGASLRTPD
jgi:Flp pilus assembly protein TadD